MTYGTIRKNKDYHIHRPLVTRISSKVSPLLIRTTRSATVSTRTSLSTPVSTRFITPSIL
jgi:hypothetical protein